MIIFTWLGVAITIFFGYMMLFGIGVIMERDSDDAAYFGALLAGIIISVMFASFITKPEKFGYQKISTVSENVVEVSK